MTPASALGARLETDVLAASAGDTLAFGRLVDQTKSAVTAVALAIVGDHPASQDIAQDVFLAAWRNLGKLGSPASFLPWLRQTTRNRAHTWLRDQGRRRLAATRVDELLPEVADGGPRPLGAARPPRGAATGRRGARRPPRRRARGHHPLLPRGAVGRPGRRPAGVDTGCRQATSVQGAPSDARHGRRASGPRAPPDRAQYRVHCRHTDRAERCRPTCGRVGRYRHRREGGWRVGARQAGNRPRWHRRRSLGGVLGLLPGLRWDFRKADLHEQQQLRRFAATGVGLMLAVSSGFALSGASGS